MWLRFLRWDSFLLLQRIEHVSDIIRCSSGIRRTGIVHRTTARSSCSGEDCEKQREMYTEENELRLLHGYSVDRHELRDLW
jgi:hypothetical protein